MANYLDYAGLEYYTELINAHLNSEISTAASTLSEQIQQGLADFSNALLFQGFIDGTTNMTTAHSDAKKGHVYIVKTAGSVVTYYPSTGSTTVTETLERGDTLICLNSPNDDSDAEGDEVLRWGALQTNWSVVLPQSTPSLSGTTEITLATIGGVDIKAKLSKALGDAATHGVTSDKNDFTTQNTDLTQAKDVVSYVTDGFVAKVSGKGLSTNDYTDAAKAKVDSIPSGTGVDAAASHQVKSDATEIGTETTYDEWLPTVGAMKDYAKPLQAAKSDPTASGTSATFIATITQNAQGVITASKKTVQSASSSQAGLMSSTHYSKLEGIATGATKDGAMPLTGGNSVQAAFNAGTSANQEPD